MAIKIGTISISLSAETASFNAEMGRASAMALNTSRQIERSFNIMAGAITAATGAAIGALGFLIEKTEDTVFQMQRMAQQAGVSTEQFSKFAYAAKVSGMPVDQLAVILTRVSHSAYEAANGSKQASDAYKAVGVSVTDANGHFKTSDQIMLELAKKLDTYRESAGKTGVETTLMGRSGAQAAELMHVLATRFDEVSDKASKTGSIIGDDTAQQAQKLHDSFIDLEQAAFGLSVRLLSQVSPALEAAVNKIVAFTSSAENMKKVDQIGQDIAKGVKLGAGALEFLINHFEAVKLVIEGLLALRVAGIFIPMISSASSTAGILGKLSIAFGRVMGSLLGVRSAAPIVAASLKSVGSAALYEAQFIGLLAKEEGAATAATYALNTSLVGIAGAVGVATAGLAYLGWLFERDVDSAEKMSMAAATWADKWHAAIDNVAEDLRDVHALMELFSGNGTEVATMKWTPYADQLSKEINKRRETDGSAPNYSTPKPEPKPTKKDFPVGGDGKIDPLIAKLKELHDRAVAAHEALMAVGLDPQMARNAEITKKYALFLDEAMKAKRKLTEAEKSAAHADITMEVNDTAATKYDETLLSLRQTLTSTRDEHLQMAAAIGKSAQAMQDAAVTAEVNREMLKMAGPGWSNNIKDVATSKTIGDDIRKRTNAENLDADKKSLDTTQQQIDAQMRLNDAVGKGADAKRAAAVANEQAAVRQDFVSRGDTDQGALEAQLQLIQKKSDAESEAANLAKASSMDALTTYRDQKQAIMDAVSAAKQYGVAIDQRQVLTANKEAWIAFNEAQDKAILATGSAMDGLKVALDQMARDTESSAQRMYEAVNQMVSALNDSITKMLMNGHFNQNRNEIRKSFATDFKGVGSSLMKQGLQKGESAILGGLGIGGKPDGSSSKPFWVKMAGGGGSNGGSGLADVTHDALSGIGIGGGSGGFGGFLSKVLGFGKMALQGAFADGTDSLIPGMPALIGEKGPELFIPPSSGSILPNSMMRNLGNGGHTINIDASGSQDPAQTKAMVMQAIVEAAPHITNNAANQVHERNLRVPSSGR